MKPTQHHVARRLREAAKREPREPTLNRLAPYIATALAMGLALLIALLNL